MKPKSYLIQLAVAAIAIPSLSYASLGGDMSSVQADQLNLKATIRIARATSNYTVHEIQATSGTVIREYIATNGTVFGVAWKGPVKPNLRQLLGQQYFDSFTASTKTQRNGHGHLLVKQSGLVVRSGGHMRAFAGSAYLPNMLPQGVSANDIL